MTSFYQRGAGFERWVQDYLQERGWLVCRSAGSRSRYDLMALPMNSGRPALIQCKMHDIGTSQERASLLALSEQFGAAAVWAYRLKDGKRELRFKRLRLFSAEPWVP